MSFWPFSNSMNNSSSLQRFLDSVQDYNAVSVDDLIGDPTLSQELLDELNNIKGNYNLSTFQLSQQGPAGASGAGSGFANTGTSLSEHIFAANGAAVNSDVVSLTSSNNDNANSNSKDGRSTKLLELLIQPHILSGFLDYMIDSVEYFHQEGLKKQETLSSMIQESVEEGKKHEETPEEASDRIDYELAHDLTSDAPSAVDVLSESHSDSTDLDSDKKDAESDHDKSARCFQTSSDILSIDLWVISNRIIETPVIMSKLWSCLSLAHLDESSPSVAYLVRILDQLMDTNSIELLNFIRRQPALVDTFLSKIEIPMLMDFFLRIIQTDKPDSPTGILETLSSQHLISKLIDILRPDPSQFVLDAENIPNPDLFFKQIAATDFIKALATISSNTALAVVLETNIGPNQLTRELVSPKIVNTMIEIMLFRPGEATEEGVINNRTNKHGINNCVSIIIELIRKNNSDYDLSCGNYTSMLQQGESNSSGDLNSYVMLQWLKDFEQNPPGPRDPIYLGEMLSLFSDNLHKFSELMELEPVAPPHTESPVLGFTKFKLSELVAELLHCSNMVLLNSKKIKKIIQIRDHVRVQQQRRLRKALNDTIVFDDSASDVQDVTTGLDDVSLDDIHFEESKSREDNDYMRLIEALDTKDDSDDEEPMISPENPFVSAEREATIKSDPCVGDYFKIKLIDSGIFIDIIIKFTQFPWHNFFHNVVFDLIQQIFNGKLNSYNSFLIVELFKPGKCDLTDLIVQSYKTSAIPRPGYLGHLILISEEVVKFTSLYKPDLISPIIVDCISTPDWEWFVNDVLLKTREVYNVVLGAEPEDAEEGEDDGEDTNKDYGFESEGVGYYEAQKSPIILGDTSNHNLFVSDHGDDVAEDDEDEGMEEVRMPDFRAQNMSPVTSQHLEEEEEDDVEDFRDTYHDDFIDNISGSSSSDDEEDVEVSEVDVPVTDNAEAESETASVNELRRVPKHNV